MQKQILFITYPFPPIAGGGVSRSVKLLKELPKHGLEPIVLTAALSKEELSKHASDHSRLEQLESSLEILRLTTRDPIRVKKFLNKILGERFYSYLRFLLFPLLHNHTNSWTFLNLLRVRKIIKQRNIKTVYTTSPPHNQLLLGYFLKLTTKVSWVADLRDPYTDGYQWHWPSKTHFKLAKILEKLFLAQADKVIVNTPEVRNIYLKRNITSENKIQVITNGF